MYKKGLSLIEIVIASIIVGIIVTPLVAIPHYAHSVLVKENNRLKALSFARQVIDDLIFETDFDDSALCADGTLCPDYACSGGAVNPHIIPASSFPTAATDGVFWTQSNPSARYTVTDFPLKDSSGTDVTCVAKKIDFTISWTDVLVSGAEQKSVTISSLKVKQ